MFVFEEVLEEGFENIYALKNLSFIIHNLFSLACRCANATRERGWKVFGLQFYGECWSGENAEATFNRYGRARASRCLQELVGPCNISKEMECVGAYRTNYIYRLKDCK